MKVNGLGSLAWEINRLEYFPAGVEVKLLWSKNTVSLKVGDTIIVKSPGGEKEEDWLDEFDLRKVICNAIQTLAKLKGKDAVRSILAKYEAKNLKEVDPRLWLDLLSDLTDAINVDDPTL